MPVVLRVGGYRFEFYASDGDEPPHMHVSKDGRQAKFWLEPLVRLSRNRGLRPHEVGEAERLVIEHRESLLEAWHAFFGR